MTQQVLALATFKRYFPPDEQHDVCGDDTKLNNSEYRRKTMVLDNITLSNLNVVGKYNSLYMKLDYCCTLFGKRLLLDYLCSPSAEIDEIRARQKAVAELYRRSDLLQSCRSVLSSLNVDLERSLAQIHQFGNRSVMKDHPSARAVLYETETYGRNKISDFAAALNAFESLMKLPEIFAGVESSLLVQLTQTSANGGSFEDMSEHVEKFKNAFDIAEAMKVGFARPERAADADYDAVLDEISELDDELKEYLKVNFPLFSHFHLSYHHIIIFIFTGTRKVLRLQARLFRQRPETLSD